MSAAMVPCISDSTLDTLIYSVFICVVSGFADINVTIHTNCFQFPSEASVLVSTYFFHFSCRPDINTSCCLHDTDI